MREDAEAFKQFALFFGRTAFLPDATGTAFVERVLKGSADYASNVGESLKESVYDALRVLMNGFFDAQANGLDRDQPDDLKRVHDTALIVLYRLLFILFAEDRDLLPVKNAAYLPYSMRDIQRDVNAALRTNRAYAPNVNGLWERLCGLCNLIDMGWETGGVTIIPAYNGGLFSAARHPTIAPDEGTQRRWRIGDAALAPVIDLLAYARINRDEPGRETVDYSSLEVQHLGSIYEGLLELQPLVASEDLIEVPDGRKVLWKPLHEVTNPRNVGGQTPRRIAPREIYLATNRGERKASGSYYTPKSIVRYIVEQTVGPLADEAARRVAELKPAFDKRTEPLREVQGPGLEAARAKIEAAERDLLAPYLELRVLDPALGSGHFLVGAADYLSFALATDPNLPALQIMGNEAPQAFYKRLVVEHCLYGVDLNPLAVELAKLSLWLHTVSRDRALSFLDHHLRCGNSLLGARLDRDLNHEPPRLLGRGGVTMTSTHFVPTAQVLADEQLDYFLRVFGELGAIGAGDAQAERDKDALYRQMDGVRARYRGIADLWMAPFFGLAVSAEFYQRAVEHLNADDASWNDFTADETWQAARQIAADKRFFHWHLEFPEVFLNASGLKPEPQRGFDAVIGNPPYITYGGKDDAQTEDDALALMRMVYASAQYKPNTFALFYENSIELSCDDGRVSFITPRTMLDNHYFRELRKFVLANCHVENLVELKYPVFDDAETGGCALAVLRKTADNEGLSKVSVLFSESQMAEEKLSAVEVKQSQFSDDPNHKFSSQDADFFQLLAHLKEQSVALGFLCTVKNGVNTGNMAAVILSRAKEDGRYEKIIEGKDIGRHSINWGGWYICYDPTLKKTFDVSKLVTRQKKVDVAFRKREIFSTPKIIIRQTSDKLIGVLDADGYISRHSTHLIGMRDPKNQPVSLAYISALFNSSLLNYVYQTTVSEVGKAFAEVKTINVEPLPIRQIDFTTPADERGAELERARGLYAAGLEAGEFGELLDWVGRALDATPARGDCVHDALAFLAGEMMRLHGARNDETRGFLDWLERRIGAPVGELSQKNRLRAYDQETFGDWIGLLAANRARLSVDPASRATETLLHDEWKESVGKLAPLRRSIEATDALIDAMVYRLYGLDEDEIKLVAGEAVNKFTAT